MTSPYSRSHVQMHADECCLDSQFQQWALSPGVPVMRSAPLAGCLERLTAWTGWPLTPFAFQLPAYKPLRASCISMSGSVRRCSRSFSQMQEGSALRHRPIIASRLCDQYTLTCWCLSRYRQGCRRAKLASVSQVGSALLPSSPAPLLSWPSCCAGCACQHQTAAPSEASAVSAAH